MLELEESPPLEPELEPELESDLVSVLLSDLVSDFESDLPSAGLASPALASSGLAWVPPRKSVAYQPEPLSWKPAAVTCLVNAEAPQAGHSVSGASDIFCRTSLLCPQDPHL